MPTYVKGCIFNLRTSFFVTASCILELGAWGLVTSSWWGILVKNTYFFAVFQMHRPQDFCGVRCEDNRRDEGQRHPRGFEPHPAGPAGGGDPQEAPGTSLHHTTGRVVPGMLTIAAFSS